MGEPADMASMWRSMLSEEFETLKEAKRQRVLRPPEIARLEHLVLQLAGFDVGREKPNLRDQGISALDAQIAALKAKIAGNGAAGAKKS